MTPAPPAPPAPTVHSAPPPARGTPRPALPRRSAGAASTVLVGLVALAGMHLSGCASGPRAGPAIVALPADEAEARGLFNAARDVLLAERLVIERADPAAGVVSTRPVDAALASAEDLLNRQLRQVRVEFRPPPAVGAAVGADVGADVGATAGAGAGAGEMQVRVLVYRVQEPGWRPSSAGVLLSSRTQDPALTARGLHPRSTTPLREDEAESRRLANAIVQLARQRRAEPAR